MKALSLKQPFAELILQGRKTIELRKWNTKFRGEFFIHASKSPDKQAMKKFGFEKLPCGCIVGKAVLSNVKEYQSTDEFWKDRDRHLAGMEWGNYGFLLENIERIFPIPAKGALKFWEFNDFNAVKELVE